MAVYLADAIDHPEKWKALCPFVLDYWRELSCIPSKEATEARAELITELQAFSIPICALELTDSEAPR